MRFQVRQVAATLVVVAAAVLVIVLVVSDLADGDHHLWRDPISYFGSVDAPHPVAFNRALVFLGLAVIVWAVVGRAGAGPALTGLTVAAGGALVLLSRWSIDCSPADGLCEALIRDGVRTQSHRIHSVVGLVFFCLLVAIVVVAHRARRTMLVPLLVTGATVVWLVVRPFAPGHGIVELAAVAAAAWSRATETKLSSRPDV